MKERIALDSTAVLQRYLPGKYRDLVLSEMGESNYWIATELVKTEILLTLHQAAVSPTHYEELSRIFRNDWDFFHVIPIDSRCLNHASQIGAQFGLKLVDALHLAALDRIPRPLKYLTFDHRQIPAAVELGIEVITPAADN
ncbi:MAG: type II toxin-antitoxin system VapC family toxin [Actinomycetota bacterium]|nr:type II toxin-antitoxin system VapC family toxin [Actinomycetota bacterium]